MSPGHRYNSRVKGEGKALRISNATLPLREQSARTVNQNREKQTYQLATDGN